MEEQSETDDLAVLLSQENLGKRARPEQMLLQARFIQVNGAPGTALWWGTDPQWCNADPNNSNQNTTYDGCVYGNGVFNEGKRQIRITDILDGTSNTFMIGEALSGKDYQNAWCHMDNAIATCAFPPNVKNP